MNLSSVGYLGAEIARTGHRGMMGKCPPPGQQRSSTHLIEICPGQAPAKSLDIGERSQWLNMDTMTQKRLTDVLPPEFMDGKFEGCPAMRHAFMDVIAAHDGPNALPWPGPQKYVSKWYVLANGKAVGWNDNPSRGWSFPVINYQETNLTQDITLRFRSVLHMKLHQVLMGYDFAFTVNADRLVGFEYNCPTLGVLLTLVDNDLEYACLKPDGLQVYSETDYSRVEWAWISEPNLPIEDALRRELHVLLKVRPALMHMPPNLG
jgi:hypothetical protein